MASRLRGLRKTMKARVSRFSTWSALVWVGSFGLGVTVFLAVADELHFEYHSYQDIVAVPAFRLYPELGDWWLYLLALALIPTLTLVGYGLWVGLVSLCHRLQGGVDQVDVAVFALPYLVWWVHPLTYAFEHHRGSVPLRSAETTRIDRKPPGPHDAVPVVVWRCQHHQQHPGRLRRHSLRDSIARLMARKPFDPSLIQAPAGERFRATGGPLTVSQVTALVKQALESALPSTVPGVAPIRTARKKDWRVAICRRKVELHLPFGS